MVTIALLEDIGVDWTGGDVGGDWSGCEGCSESDGGDENEDERGELHGCGLSGNILIKSCSSECSWL